MTQDMVDLASLWAETVDAFTLSGQSDLSSTATAWDAVTQFLKPDTLEASTSELAPSDEVVKAVGSLQQAGLIVDLLDWHCDEVSRAFPTIIVPDIQAHIDDVPALLVRLATYLQLWSQPHEALAAAVPESSSVSSSPSMVFRKFFLGKLYPLLTTQTFIDNLYLFFQSTMDMDNTDTMDEEALNQLSTTTNCLRAMHYLTLLDRFESVLFKVVYAHIEQRIAETCAEDFETEGLLQTVGDWLAGDIGNWLISIYALAFDGGTAADGGNSTQARMKATKVLRPAIQRFEWHVYSTMFNTRAKEMFDIIVDYPASLPAIRDLATCLTKTDQKTHLVRLITRQIRKRLLHPGANTKDILSQYINLIRVFRALDPPGVLLAQIAAEMRSYLRGRRDTIPCIVAGMVDEEGDLLKELRGDGGDIENGTVRLELREKQEDEAEDYTDDGYKWVPAPVDAPVDYTRNKTADVIQLLVSIYDSNELFVRELQRMLAERLLAIRDYNFSRELRNVEILKIRFGEAALSGLEVMLKDCADSKRVDVAIHGQNDQATNATASNPLHATVVSHLFWPTMARQSLKLPGQLGKLAASYERAFRKVKQDKKLQWMPTLGTVTLEVAMQDRTVEMEVTPIQAAVLETFSEISERSMRDIRTVLKVENSTRIRSALHFWESKTILVCLAADAPEEDLMWTPLESVPEGVQEAMSALAAPTQHLHRSGPSQSVSAPLPVVAPAVSTEAAIAAISPYLPFIQNALTNLGALPATRLHSMLVALAPDYASRPHTTLQDLEAFLDAGRRDGWLSRSGPNYTIRR